MANGAVNIGDGAGNSPIDIFAENRLITTKVESATSITLTAFGGEICFLGSLVSIPYTSLAIGTNPAQSGALRLANDQAVMGRRNDIAADILLIKAGLDNSVNVGNSDTYVVLNGARNFSAVMLELPKGLNVSEQTAPTVPEVNKANLWLQDNGAGKSQLMVQFTTGAPVQLAIQP